MGISFLNVKIRNLILFACHTIFLFFWKYEKVGRIQSSCSKKGYYKKTLVLTQRRSEQLQSYGCGVWSKQKNAWEFLFSDYVIWLCIWILIIFSVYIFVIKKLTENSTCTLLQNTIWYSQLKRKKKSLLNLVVELLPWDCW